MDHRKLWTQNQDQLRKALGSKAHFTAAIELFLAQHAAVHTAEVSGGGNWSVHDEALAGLTEAQIRWVPRPGQNSIAWLLWHITRIEDMTINLLTFEQPQVINAEWLAQLGLSRLDCGASMDENEVAELSASISVPALLAYRAAVGRKTRASLPALTAEQVKAAVPEATVAQLLAEGSISEKGRWLYEYYLNRTKGFFLTRTATSHNFIHLNEAGRLRIKLFGLSAKHKD